MTYVLTTTCTHMGLKKDKGKEAMCEISPFVCENWINIGIILEPTVGVVISGSLESSIRKQQIN